MTATLAMVETLIDVWRVPAGHEGKILDSRADERTWVELKHIGAAGLLKPGTRLKPRPGSWPATEAVVTRDGALDVDGKKFQSPSGAGRYVKGAVTNGWSFWRLDDGRRLSDVRAAYRGERPEQNDEPGPLSEWGADDFDAAVTVWSGITLKARELFRAVIAAAPQRVSADDLAQELQLDSGASVAGLLSWPTRVAVRAGRPAPIRAHDGTPTAYWMDRDTAALFAAVASAQS
jgi:Restriction Enzyme Adenine Methylase Associated/Family of unknown function (DUF6416)